MPKVDLNAIKEKVQTILEDANTTTASTDLSGGLANKRVLKVYKVHPKLRNLQADLYNACTVWITNKDMSQITIAGTQSRGQRKSVITINIAGMIFNPNITAADIDPADEDINNLMENIEQIIRDDQTLGGLVKFSQPSETKYYNDQLEEVNLRTGIMKLNATIFH